MTDVAAPRGADVRDRFLGGDAVVVGFASTILLIMEAARAVGATPGEQASWAAALCFGMAITTFRPLMAYKMPIITAWSTRVPHSSPPAPRAYYSNALGAFVVSGR